MARAAAKHLRCVSCRSKEVVTRYYDNAPPENFCLRCGRIWDVRR